MSHSRPIAVLSAASLSTQTLNQQENHLALCHQHYIPQAHSVPPVKSKPSANIRFYIKEHLKQLLPIYFHCVLILFLLWVWEDLLERILVLRHQRVCRGEQRPQEADEALSFWLWSHSHGFIIGDFGELSG